MANDRFVYVTYIRTTPEKLWDALLKPEFTRLYWFGVTQESEWKKGASWKIVLSDGRVADAGEILEIEKPRRLGIKWRNEFRPDLKAEGYSQCTIEIEPTADAVKLTVVPRDCQAGLEIHRGGFRRLAENPIELKEHAGNRQGA